MNTELNNLSNTELLALYNELRDTLSDLDEDTDFSEYMEVEEELYTVEDELAVRGL